MKNNANLMKSIALVLVMVTMVCCLAGCVGKQVTAVVTFDNITGGRVIGFPRVQGLGVGLQLNELTINVRQEGVYPLLLELDGETVTFTLTYENGKFTAEADADIAYTLKG